MQPDELYHEELSSFWGRFLIAEMFGLCVFSLVAYFWIRAEAISLDWIALIFSGVFLLLGLLTLNYATLTVSVTSRGINMAYGRFRHSVSWENIAGYEMNPGSGLLDLVSFTGVSRTSRRKDGWSLIYYTAGAPVILLELKQQYKYFGWQYKYMGFSTRQPERIAELIKNHQG
jgi:hypothetical protein